VLLFLMTTGSFPWHVAERGDEGFDALLAGELEIVEPWRILTATFAKVCVRVWRPWFAFNGH
jgi:hypothetical protein